MRLARLWSLTVSEWSRRLTGTRDPTLERPLGSSSSSGRDKYLTHNQKQGAERTDTSGRRTVR
jgi:hypothetical protein